MPTVGEQQENLGQRSSSSNRNDLSRRNSNSSNQRLPGLLYAPSLSKRGTLKARRSRARGPKLRAQERDYGIRRGEHGWCRFLSALGPRAGMDLASSPPRAPVRLRVRPQVYQPVDAEYAFATAHTQGNLIRLLCRPRPRRRLCCCCCHGHHRLGC